MLGKRKTYDGLVAPLKKMLADLTAHITKENNNIQLCNAEKEKIMEDTKTALELQDERINTSRSKIGKSQLTVDKLKDIVVLD